MASGAALLQFILRAARFIAIGWRPGRPPPRVLSKDPPNAESHMFETLVTRSFLASPFLAVAIALSHGASALPAHSEAVAVVKLPTVLITRAGVQPEYEVVAVVPAEVMALDVPLSAIR